MSRAALVWLASGVALVLVAFLIGRQLRGTDASASAFDLDAPAYVPAGDAAGYSKAGFSGFTETAGEGLTVLSGRIVTTTADSVTVEIAGGQRTTIRLNNVAPLKRLEPSSRDALRPGVTVLVHRSGDEAAAVLVVSAP